jgi:chemotaxis protein MotB
MIEGMMKNTEQSTRLLPLCLCAVVLTSCVSQEEFDEAKELARHYQVRLHDVERERALLVAENERLATELAMGGVAALDAGFSQEFESRLNEYERMLAGLRDDPGPVSKYTLGDGSTLYMVQDAVLFDSGSADIGDDGQSRLADIAAEIQVGSHGRIWVRGHTDDDPVVRPGTLQKFPHGNLHLATRRALEVAAVLVRSGVGAENVAVAGFGPFVPLRPNDTAANKSLNRRVEIYVSKGE